MNDEFTSPNADAGRGREDWLFPTVDLTYVLNEALESILSLPFGLMVSAGITAEHPAQSDDNEEILWPVFYNTFGENRAANNYGSVYFDIIAVY